MPELSVIVPVYNVRDYLSACIESILTQTLRDLELILINDGSPDDCGVICDAYAQRDARVRVIHQHNQGVSAARNAGLRIASGSWVAFVDPDDWVDAKMFAILYRSATENGADIAVCGFIFCSQEGQELYRQPVPTGSFSQEELLLSIYGMPNRFHGSMCNKLFRRSLLDGLQFDMTVAIGEDWLLLYECYKRCRKASSVSECLYSVRTRSGSATRKVSADLYVQKLQTYLRLFKYSKRHSKTIRRQAYRKILDSCIVNKQEIRKCPDSKSPLAYVNRMLRRLSVPAFLQGSISIRTAVYYFREGLRF